MIQIKVKILFKEYLKLIADLTYRKPMMILILFVDALMITWIILANLKINGVPELTIFQYFTVIIITIIQPLVVYSIIHRNYYSSAHLMEPIEINIDTEVIVMYGKSFKTELQWNKIYQVKEIKNWYLIYQNSLNAIIIPKKILKKDQESDFKEILKGIKGLNLLLKHR